MGKSEGQEEEEGLSQTRENSRELARSKRDATEVDGWGMDCVKIKEGRSSEWLLLATALFSRARDHNIRTFKRQPAMFVRMT